LPLKDWINPETGRIYPEFDQTGTATGRLSCKKPNLQNIPIRDELGKKVRNAFVAEEGFLLISADYSQIELRILAHLSKDETLQRAFLEDKDIHGETAKLLFGDESQRRMAKMVNYGITYGMSAFGLAQRLGIPYEEADIFIRSYFYNFPGVKTWIEKTLKFARENGYVRTIYGRIRHVPEINNPNRQVRELMERIAVNSPIQGSAADLIKLAMIKIEKEFERNNLDAGIVLQIHDELLVESPEDKVEIVKEIVRNGMEQAMEFDVPIKVEIGIGKSWLEAHGD
jgi:DNA polymerase-1